MAVEPSSCLTFLAGWRRGFDGDALDEDKVSRLVSVLIEVVARLRFRVDEAVEFVSLPSRPPLEMPFSSLEMPLTSSSCLMIEVLVAAPLLVAN